jgi:hypothetical protein
VPDHLSPDAIARRLFVLSDVLGHLTTVGLGEDPDAVEHAWQAVAAIAKGQLEQALEARAT